MDEMIVSGAQRFDRVANAEIHGAPGMLRTSAQAGSSPTDIGLTTVALGADTRHCVIRDVHNVGWAADVNGGGTPRIHGILYDVRVYNIGWQTAFPGDRSSEAGGHGQALYTQNYSATGQKVIDTCVFVAAFSWMKIYGSNGEIQDPVNWTANPLSKLSGYTIRNSIFVSKGFLIGGVSYGADMIYIDGCAFLDCVLLMGNSGQNGTGTVTGCLLTRGFHIICRAAAGVRNAVDNRLVSWEALRFTDNVVIIPRGATVDVTYDSPTWLWDDNTYYSEEERPFVLRRENPDWVPTDKQSPQMLPAQRLTFAEWQATTGFDKNSTYHAGLPDAPMVREYAVEGVGKRAANVAVYNPTRLPEVAISGSRSVPLNGMTPLPDGWAGRRAAPLPREILPVHGWFRVEEAATAEDDAAAKIAALEARLVAHEATLAEQAAALLTAKTTLAEQEKIADAARALWSAADRFGALMEAKK